MSSSAIDYRIHTASREGEPADTSDDAAGVRPDGWPIRAAVADGATESVYAGTWAQCLVEQLGAVKASASGFAAAVEAARSGWQEAVQDAAEQPWYVTAKLEEGAFATALGLSVGREGQWQAVVAGDCCLFQLRDGGLHRAWPTADPEGFTHRPTLVASRATREAPTPKTATGTWGAGDIFLLATDAVAAWLLRTDLVAAAAWDDEAFHDAVVTAREDGELRNDDATLVVLEMRRRPPTEDDGATPKA